MSRASPPRAAFRKLLLVAGASAALHAILAPLGDLREHLPAYLAAHAAGLALMLLAWRVVRRGGAELVPLVIGVALVLRLIAAWGDPALSDDVYRFVWDGRVQVHGVHPYAHAPDDPALAPLRDEGWSRINHPSIPTIYPPLAQALFALLAALGAGATGFKLALGLLDWGVVLALDRMLGLRGLPRDRLVLYAWNPLAVMETAGSGHVEPLGVLLLLLALGWARRGRLAPAALALAGAIHAKLAPAVTLPALGPRLGPRALALLVLALAAPVGFYAAWGPAVGAGLFEYARRWEHNALLFGGLRGALEWLDPAPWLTPGVATLQRVVGGDPAWWDVVYRSIWPRELARLIAGGVLAAWLVRVALRERRDSWRASYLALGGLLLLSPTLHPWYVLWVLPFAAAELAWGWLAFAALLPLSHLGGPGAVPTAVLWIEYLPLVVWLLWRARAAPEVRRSGTIPP